MAALCVCLHTETADAIVIVISVRVNTDMGQTKDAVTLRVGCRITATYSTAYLLLSQRKSATLLLETNTAVL
jgi:hypothetical protein